MASIDCTVAAPGDFTLNLGAASYYCVTDTPSIVLLEAGAMTQAEFLQLWPALIGLFVTAFIFKFIRKQF